MNRSFASAMGQALRNTRAGNTGEATRIIQAALSGRTPGSEATSGGTGTDGLRQRMRQPLGQVVNTLSKGRSRGLARQGGSGARPEVPEGATYVRRSHGAGQGTLDYTLFTPSPRGEPVRGVILMLHGCTQDADDFAAGTQMNLHAERENLVVAYPEQSRGANTLGCWNWFRAQDQQRGGGEPAMLAGLAEALGAEFGVAPGQTFVAGLSAGGAMAAILGAVYGDVFGAVGVHSGLAPGAARDVMGAYSAMAGQGKGGMPSGMASAGFGAAATPAIEVPTIVIHGTGDSTVHPDNGAKVLAAAVGAASGVTAETGDDRTATVHRDGTGRVIAESWTVPGLGHAWSGGSSAGTYCAPGGVDASAEMMRFFLAVGDDRIARLAS